MDYDSSCRMHPLPIFTTDNTVCEQVEDKITECIQLVYQCRTAQHLLNLHYAERSLLTSVGHQKPKASTQANIMAEFGC